MTDYESIGSHRIATGLGCPAEFPFAWASNTPFRMTSEYTVDNFDEEVGFWTTVFGFETVALDNTSVLFTAGAKDFWFAVRRADVDYPLSSPTGFSLMFMTQEMGSARATLATRLDGQFSERREPSGQVVLRFSSPFGIPVEIWHDPT